MAKPTIIKSELLSMLNDKGMSRKEIAEYYQIPVGQLTLAMKQLNLKGARTKKIAFEVLDDTIVAKTSTNTGGVDRTEIEDDMSPSTPAVDVANSTERVNTPTPAMNTSAEDMGF